MANFYGAERSNYVRFKADKFEEVTDYLKRYGVEIKPNRDNPELVCLLPQEGFTDDGMFGQWHEDGDGVETELDLSWVAMQMEDGQVLVIESVGHEKLRYLSGYAEAWDSKGNHTAVNIVDIYSQAAKEFKIPRHLITTAAY